MADVFYYEYPWLRILGQGMDASHAKWRASGVLEVPRGAAVSVPGRNHRIKSLGHDAYEFALPLNKSDIVFRVSEPPPMRAERDYVLEHSFIFNAIPAKKDFRATELYKTVISWSSFFDECLIDEERGKSLSWSRISDLISDFERNPDEPQMSLIVRIAQEIGPVLNDYYRGVRRVLKRDRRMMPADKAEEFDHGCLEWYIRQPGINAAEKAAFNQQRLKAVARKEFVDTLENRVLKDFLIRCRVETDVYRLACTPSQQKSKRARAVQLFGKLCSSLLSLPLFETISAIKGTVQPNYVLQGDPKYRKIWKHYCLLLRKQRAYDTLWQWQSELWNDIATVTAVVALTRLIEETGKGDSLWSIRPIAEGLPDISFEQHEGERLVKGSVSGPFLIRRRGRQIKDAIVLDVIHGKQLDQFFGAKRLGVFESLRRTCASVVLFLTPLNGAKPAYVFLWPVHALADGYADVVSMKTSMDGALKHISTGSSSQAFGIALVSSEAADTDIETGSVFPLKFSANIAGWSKNIDLLKQVFTELFGSIVK